MCPIHAGNYFYSLFQASLKVCLDKLYCQVGILILMLANSYWNHKNNMLTRVGHMVTTSNLYKKHADSIFYVKNMVMKC